MKSHPPGSVQMKASDPVSTTPFSLNNNSSNPTLVRYQHQPSNVSDRAPGPGFDMHVGHRERGGTLTVVGRGDVVSKGFATSRDLPDNRNPKDILQTGTSPWGTPRAAGELKPTDRVTVNGMEMTVQVAERMGLISRSATGGYEGSGKTPEAVLQEQVQPDVTDLQAPAREGFDDPNTERLFNAVTDRVARVEQVQVMNSLIDSIATKGQGEVAGNLFTTVAGQMGVEGHEAETIVGRMVGAFSRQAAKAVQDVVPVDPDDVWDWARQNQPRELRDAMRRQAMERTTEGYKALATKYLETLGETDPTSILSAELGPGVSVRKGVDGQPVLRLEGIGEVSYRTAIRSGFIKVSRGGRG